MASSPRPAPDAPRRCARAGEDRAVFAARKEFELLKLVSTDRRAFKTLRLLRRPFEVPTWGETPIGASPHVGEVPSPKGDGTRGRRRRRRRRKAGGEDAREARREEGNRAPSHPGRGDKAHTALSPPLEGEGAALNARQRRHRIRAEARASCARRSLITVCLVVAFVARLRSRVGTARCLARQRTHMLGEGGGSVEGIEALARVSPKRSYSELSPGYGQNLLSLSSPIACGLASHAMEPHANLQPRSQSPTERPAKARLVVLRL